MQHFEMFLSTDIIQDGNIHFFKESENYEKTFCFTYFINDDFRCFVF